MLRTSGASKACHRNLFDAFSRRTCSYIEITSHFMCTEFRKVCITLYEFRLEMYGVKSMKYNGSTLRLISELQSDSEQNKNVTYFSSYGAVHKIRHSAMFS